MWKNVRDLFIKWTIVQKWTITVSQNGDSAKTREQTFVPWFSTSLDEVEATTRARGDSFLLAEQEKGSPTEEGQRDQRPREHRSLPAAPEVSSLSRQIPSNTDRENNYESRPCDWSSRPATTANRYYRLQLSGSRGLFRAGDTMKLVALCRAFSRTSFPRVIWQMNSREAGETARRATKAFPAIARDSLCQGMSRRGTHSASKFGILSFVR